MLPCTALNMGVRMTVIATTPMKYGPNGQALWGLPLKKKAGRCQMPHIPPSIRLDASGEKRSCKRGKATPRQPNSSTGPMASPTARAASTSYQGLNGKWICQCALDSRTEIEDGGYAEDQEGPP